MLNTWTKQTIRKLPWGAGTFLTGSVVLFIAGKGETAAYICLIVSIIALFLSIRFHHYEKIIERQEKQITDKDKQLSKYNREFQANFTKGMQNLSSIQEEQVRSMYTKTFDDQTPNNGK